MPGIPVSMPDIRPPDKPPTRTEIMVAKPWAGGIEKVKGKVRTIAMAIVKPGIDPAINPAPTPTVIKISVDGSTMFKKAGKKMSIRTKAPSEIHVAEILQEHM